MQTGHTRDQVQCTKAPEGDSQGFCKTAAYHFWNVAAIMGYSRSLEKQEVTHIYKNKRKYCLVSLTSALLVYPLETISKNVKAKKVTGNSQNGLTKVKTRLSNLTAFYDKLTAFVD